MVNKNEKKAVSEKHIAPHPRKGFDKSALWRYGATAIILLVVAQLSGFNAMWFRTAKAIVSSNLKISRRTHPSNPASYGGPVTGQITLLAGAVGVNLYIPSGIAVDADGNMYVADMQNNLIRKITKDGIATVVAGTVMQSAKDGRGSAAGFFFPAAISIDPKRNLIVADSRNHSIRMITPDGLVTTLAGGSKAAFVDGQGRSAAFNWPSATAIDKKGNIYVADEGNNAIRKIDISGRVTTIAGDGQPGFINGIGQAARFNQPDGIVVDDSGSIYVSDGGNNVLRKITPDGLVSTFAGSGAAGLVDGLPTVANFNAPAGLASDSKGNIIVADEKNHAVRKVTGDGVVSTVARDDDEGANNGFGRKAKFFRPEAVSVDRFDNLYVVDGDAAVRKIDPTGKVTTAVDDTTGGPPDATGGNFPFGELGAITSDAFGNLYVVDNSNYCIWKILPSGQVMPMTAVGEMGYQDGTAANAKFSMPSGLAMDATGNLLIADTYNNVVRKITRQGQVITIAGVKNFAGGPQDGDREVARLNFPNLLAVDKSGNIFFTETSNRIREITPDGHVATVAGGGSDFYGNTGFRNGPGDEAMLGSPEGLVIDHEGNLYVADSVNHAIRMISANGDVSTLAGGARSYAAFPSANPHHGYFEPGGFADGDGDDAEFNAPKALAIDKQDHIYVADTNNQMIRMVTTAGHVSSMAGLISAVDATIGPLPGSIGRPNGIAVLPNGDIAITVKHAVLVIKGAHF